MCGDTSSPVAPSTVGTAPRYALESNERTRDTHDVVTFCDGTVLTLDGQEHSTSRVTDLPNGDYHLGWHGNAAGTATAATGERYTYNFAFNLEYNVNKGLTATQVQHITLIGHDGVPSERLRLFGRTTINANGEVTSQRFFEDDPSCAGAAQ